MTEPQNAAFICGPDDVDESAGQATHHPDCDGFRIHSVAAVQLADGTWKASCPLCGMLPSVGSSGSPASALSVHREHEHEEPCDSRCLYWADLEPDPDARRDWDRDTQAIDESRRDGEDAHPTGRAEA